MTLPTSDEGGRQLAGHILAAAGRGDDHTLSALLAPLDADQLRTLVTVIVRQVDQSPPETAAGPEAVCKVAIAAAARTFGVTPEAIVSKERSRTVSDARAVAMAAARQQGLSLPAIGQAMNKDHASVVHAVRRTAERPRLADAAARISAHIQERFTAAPPPPEPAPAPVISTYTPNGVVQHAIAAAATEFGTTPEELIGPRQTRLLGDARAVAMTAARMQGQTLTRIAREFDRNHATVLAATRRIAKTPPLHELAAKVAQALPAEPQSEVPAAAPVDFVSRREQQRAAASSAPAQAWGVAR